jgi:hypothetical protein
MDESNHLLIVYEHVLRPLILPRPDPNPNLALTSAFASVSIFTFIDIRLHTTCHSHMRQNATTKPHKYA